jgi:DNA mismatch repair protein MutL
LADAQGKQPRGADDTDTLRLTYVGAAFKTYLIFEAGDRLLLVDQHAAHERVLYDRFMARYEGARVSQPLLAPQTVRLTARDVAMLQEMQPELTEAGFDVEAFDAATVAVRAIPVILGQNEPVRDLLLAVWTRRTPSAAGSPGTACGGTSRRWPANTP